MARSELITLFFVQVFRVDWRHGETFVDVRFHAEVNLVIPGKSYRVQYCQSLFK